MKSMAKFNPENERIKRQYLGWEKEANGKGDQTLNNIRAALYLFEEFTQFSSFKQLTKETIIAFKKDLMQKKNQRTKAPVSKIYLLHTTKYLKSFFIWLCSQKGYKKRISPPDLAYFNLSDRDMQIAYSKPTKKIPTLNQIERVVEKMPAETEVQKRDRALIAFLILTGMRVNAVTSLKLKHVSIEEGRVEQDPNEVKTKFGKRIVTYFFPVNDLFKNIFIDWVNYLKVEKHLGYDAPLFPRTKLELDHNDKFKRESLSNEPWQSTTAIRDILKAAFQAAGLPYYNPHSFRDTLVRLAYTVCKNPEAFRVVSQNIGHNNPLTTFTSYGTIDEYRQGEVMKSLGKNNETTLTEDEIRNLKNLIAQPKNSSSM